jgi:Holliday junction resolvase RusA-like endonuclease
MPADFTQFIGPVRLTLDFWMLRPSKHLKANGAVKATAPTYITSKPDFDNLAKAVADQLTNCNVWADDGQVALAAVCKRYANPGEATGCRITIEALQ